MHQGFSKFSWALALFCFPSVFWILAILVSPSLSDHPNLSDRQIDLFSMAFWIYPAVLLGVAGLLNKVHKTNPTLAKGLLVASFVAFYSLCGYIFSQL